MNRFFVTPDQIQGDQVIITGDDVKHIIKVLRLQRKDNIIVSDGQGMDFLVELGQVSMDNICTTIIQERANSSEPPVQITLFQGIPKSDKMEYIIQKNTELGVFSIVPVETSRSVVRLGQGKDLTKKIDRWQKVAGEAAKQSHRGRIPAISHPMTYGEAINAMKDYDLRLMPYEKENTRSLKDVLRNVSVVKKVAVFIGPEGGFDDQEIAQSRAGVIETISLGPRILRTETAGAAVMAVLMYEMGGL